MYQRQADLQKKHGQIIGCPYLSVGSETCTQDEAIRSQVQRILQSQVRYFESAIRDAQAAGLVLASDPSATARCLFALFEGSLAQARIHNDLELLRILPENALDLISNKRLQPAG
jgi:TetR/AcrR family transcriptional repressor of nem operon